MLYLPNYLFFMAYLTRCVRKGKAAHVIRIGNSPWCLNSAVTSDYPMEDYVREVNVAGFANTMPKRSSCNARFVTVNDRVFLVSTKPIAAGQEVIAYYKRLDNC